MPFRFAITLRVTLAASDVCMKQSSLANRANSYDAYCGPLSETTDSGIPCLAKMDLRCRITSGDVIAANLAIST